MGFYRFLALAVALIVLASSLAESSQGSQLEDPYRLLGLRAEYEYPPLKLSKYLLFFPLPLSKPPSPLLLAKYRFLLEEILSPDKKWYSYLAERWRGMIIDDPFLVSSDLESYIQNVIRDPRRENFYYRFSWHVVGYDGSYYTVVLKLKIYYYDFVNKRVIYEFSEIVETVKVSVYDRRVVYEGVNVGIWPFWLMSWERSEGAKVKLAEVSPFFELNNVTNPLKILNLDFDARVGRASFQGFEAIYFRGVLSYLRDVLGIVAERVLSAAPVSGNYKLVGEEKRIFGESWIEAYMRMLKKYYPQLLTGVEILWGVGGELLLYAPGGLYDAVTGAALQVFGLNDVFLMVIPSEHFMPITSLSWLIVSLTRYEGDTTLQTEDTKEIPGIPSFEIAIAALTVLAVSAAIITIIFRRGTRSLSAAPKY